MAACTRCARWDPAAYGSCSSPRSGPGARYKYEILGADGELVLKADPYAQEAEVPPKTASVVFRSEHEWSEEDARWLSDRAESEPLNGPVSIYEVHLGSWRLNSLEGNRPLSYPEAGRRAGRLRRDMGFTHVELLPIMAHPFSGSWGYQVSGYYAPTPRYGTPDEVRAFVQRLHECGVGVILDWVPAHFPRDQFALARFDGTALYEHADPRRGEHPDWGTLVFNLGRHEVRNFLISNALFWMREYHVDGIRVDAVASMLYLDYSRREGEWVPNQFGGREDLDAVAFLKQLNEVLYGREPGIISTAEESTAWPGVSRPTYVGGLGFGFKWNMGWMHDTLSYFQQDPIYRRYHHHELTFSLMYAFSENFILPLSHDEVVHGKGSLLGKMPGDRWQKLANLRALYAYMWAHPGKKLLFMGCEFAQESEWSHERSLDWHLLERPDHAGIQSLVRDLNRLYRDEPALWELDSDPSGFWWIEPNDADANVVAFARQSRDGERVVVFVANLSPVPREGYRLGLPRSVPVARGDQHRLNVLRRQRPGQPRRRGARADPLARPAGFGRGDAAAAGRRLAGPGLLVDDFPGRGRWERGRSTTSTSSSGSGRRDPGRSRWSWTGARCRWRRPEYGVYEVVAPARAGDDYLFLLDGRRVPDPCSRWQPEGLRGPPASSNVEPP